jgi:HlyD family secretion protein
MDKIIAKKSRKWYVWVLLALAVLGLLSLLLWSFEASRRKVISVAASRITISEVGFGDYQDQIPVIGQLEPVHTRLLDAVVGGLVEERFAEPGTFVKAGQPLLRLSNTSLQLDFMQRETQIVEQMNNLRNIRITLELNKRQLEDQLLQLDAEFIRVERQYQIDSRLFQDKVIAAIDYENSRTQYDMLGKRRKMLQASQARENEFRNSQLHRIDAGIQMMERNLAAIRRNLEQLTLRAPISGQLTALDAEIGQTKTAGQNIGRIDRLDSFKVRAQVDEHFLTRLKAGQIASFELNGKQYELLVYRVLPQVNGGQFAVDLSFTSAIPAEALLRGQSLQLRIALGEQKKAMLLPAGGFYSSSGGQYVYVVDEQDQARKRAVVLGRQNPRMIEVIDGLEAGEKVITSGYDGFDQAALIRIER